MLGRDRKGKGKKVRKTRKATKKERKERERGGTLRKG
jgi:hypothetical protein